MGFTLLSQPYGWGPCVSLAIRQSFGGAWGDWGPGKESGASPEAGGIIVFYERDTGPADNPTLKQSLMTHPEGRVTRAPVRGDGWKSAPPCHAGVDSVPGQKVITASLRAQRSLVVAGPQGVEPSPEPLGVFFGHKSLEPELVWAPGQGSQGRGAFKAMGHHCEIPRALITADEVNVIPWSL